jgi:phage terminase small subunit
MNLIQELRSKSRRQIFAMELVANDLNVTRTAKAMGLELSVAKGYWKCADVQVMVKDIVQRRAEAKSITIESIASELNRIAFANVGDFLDENGEVNIMSVMRPDAAAVAEVVTTQHEVDGRVTTRKRIKLHDKMRALELLGRHQAMFTDRLEVEGLDTLAEEMKAARVRAEDNGK